MNKTRKHQKPRPYALVKSVPCPGEKRGPFPKNAKLVFLGEIPNMSGHCVVVDLKTGRIQAGHHTERFEELSEDET